MARKVQVQLIDDMDGSQADESITFAVDGQGYEIDLSSEHAQEFREALAKWVAAGRRVRSTSGSSKPARRSGGSARSGPSSDELRTWARANGFTVADRGRLSVEVQQAYAAAH